MPSPEEENINDSRLSRIGLFRIGNIEGREEEQKLPSKGPHPL